MILTITLNPTIDKSTVVENILPDSKLRCQVAHNEAGGGGINVSKALRKLNTPNVAMFPAGGNIGRLLQQLLEADGIDMEVIEIPGETRENFIVMESATNKQFRFNMPGEPLDENILKHVVDHLEQQTYTYVVGSGSLPPGLPVDAYAQLARATRKNGGRFVLDTSGDALEAALPGGVFLIKPNIGELAKLSKIEWLELDKVEMAAKKLIDDGKAELVAVSMGKDGAMLVSARESYKVPVPQVEKKSTVGAGDSMVAGMLHMLENQKSLKEVICYGVACGTAATMNPGTQLFLPEDVEKIYQWTLQAAEKLG